jgi:hypothetical protein
VGIEFLLAVWSVAPSGPVMKSRTFTTFGSSGPGGFSSGESIRRNR